MRFIIREQDFERPQAAGLFHYTLNGQPTGLTEEWRLSRSAGGYLFLRVDVDGRRSGGKDSTLYHLALNPSWKAERLKFRYLCRGLESAGDVLLSEDGVTLSRVAQGHRFEQAVTYGQSTEMIALSDDMLDMPVFWFATVLGTALLVAGVGSKPGSQSLSTVQLTGPSLSGDKLSDDAFILSSQEVSLEVGQWLGVAIGRDTVTARPFSITASGHERRIWVDESGRLPVKMEFASGLVAKETRYIRYGSLIDHDWRDQLS